ncbi:MAG: hypothetical protein HON94_13110 [Methylococcales bacterium]|jgi:type IV pilus assembly protein PilX|nr:hypothetical protein [Methylococcales bacterium]MBT7411245.1 hypothetical protein [Methylococcales bacterium]
MSNNTPHQQSGMVLILSLVMLAVLTMLGTTTLQLTKMDEKISGNFQDYDLAFSSAEGALGQIEELMQVGTVNNLDIRLENTFTQNNPGFYHKDLNAVPANVSSALSLTVPLKDLGIKNKPTYLIEWYEMKSQGGSSSSTVSTVSDLSDQAINPVIIYRIITKSEGARQSSGITLESYVGLNLF